jgi:anti-sigma B factor antagonist
MPVGEFRMSVSSDGARRTLLLGGELDLVSAGELEGAVSRLCSEELVELVLDLRELTFVDSTGLRAILTCWEFTKGRCGFLLVPGPRAVQRLFEVTGLSDRLPFDGLP